MKLARIIDGMAVDVSSDPATQFHPDLAATFVEVPEDVLPGWRLGDDGWEAPAEGVTIPTAPAAEYRLQVSPVEFKMLFMPLERLAIRQAREYAGDDAALKTAAMLIDDWWTIVDDPRLAAVDLSLAQTQAGLDMLVSGGILTQARRDEIGLGVPL